MPYAEPNGIRLFNNELRGQGSILILVPLDVLR